MRFPVLLAVLLTASATFAFERFDGTFYLNRDRVTWVIVMNRDKGYEVFGPEGQYASGKYRSTEDHLTFILGDQKRRFHFDWEGENLKLGYRESDNIDPNGALANIPPSRESQNREIYISERQWLGSGRPKFAKGAPAPVPVAVAPVGPAPVAPPVSVPAQNFADIAGVYYLPAPGNQRELLAISTDGQFEYTPLAGAKANGSVSRLGDELLFISPVHRRAFTLRSVAGGLEFTRKESDVVKGEDPLGKMPPQEREPFTWLRTSGAPEARALAPLPEAAAGINGLNQLKGVVPTAQPAPAPAAAGAAPDLASLIGAYVHKPNPFISETVVFAGNGSFSYKDSNGASATGVFSLVDGTLTITSGEVVRKFKATQDGKALTLICAPDDAPKFKNDLASMSPTVLKTARYEKQ